MPSPYADTREATTEFGADTRWLDIEQHFHLDVEAWRLEAFTAQIDLDRISERRHLYDIAPALDLGQRKFTVCGSAAFTPHESPNEAPLSWAAGKAAWAMLMPSFELLAGAPWGPAQLLDVVTEVRLSGTNTLVLTMHHPLEEIRASLYRE